MTENITNTSWFRSFARSGSGGNHNNNATTGASNTTTTKQPQSFQPPSLQTRHTFHRVPTPISTPVESPTTDSPPTRRPNNAQHHPQGHHHRKSAGATLRTVSSFLSLKNGSHGSGGKIGRGRGRTSSSADADLKRADLGLGQEGGETEVKREKAKRRGREEERQRERRASEEAAALLIHAPASLSMLPLTDVDYASSSVLGLEKSIYGAYGARNRSGSGGGVASPAGVDREKEMVDQGTWHNPNLMQMAEMLSSVMGRMSSSDRLDPRYHSCVLSLIEGFYQLTRKLRETEEKLDELQDLRERELDEFRGMTEEWMETGEAYKAEVKRLELALAKESKDGMASVALARNGSLVDRIGSKRFHARLKQLNNVQIQDINKSKKPTPAAQEQPDYVAMTGSMPRILDRQNDIELSRMLELRELEERQAHQKRQGGRLRAPPVFIHGHGAPESQHMFEETPRAQQLSFLDMNQGALDNTMREDVAGDCVPQARHVPQNSLSSLSTDNESISSSSSSSSDSDAGQSRGPFRLFGKTRGKPEKTNRKQSSLSDPTGLPHSSTGKVKGGMSRLMMRSERFSNQESSLEPPPSNKDRRRRYSFEKGGDDLLTVTSPTFGPEVSRPCASSAGEGATNSSEAKASTRAKPGLRVIIPGRCDYEPSRTPLSDAGSSSVSHSTSMNTVRWVGEGGNDSDIAASPYEVDEQGRTGSRN
ncbi:uncharacterized protein C8A04DRAFT_24895 [Dichotomopilus funicola]|uniref:Uncharacterized protein n=1 Tax=Dichotomopilus funicola TaxID=1934379 RepID=A0AAN6V9Z6_9PEZI|nr:hypothetical protein C8A04DRAFT_24895 [Dichotomopilus funicola]